MSGIRMLLLPTTVHQNQKDINQIEVFYILIYSRFLTRASLVFSRAAPSRGTIEGPMLRANVVCLGARRDKRTTVVGWFEDEGKCSHMFTWCFLIIGVCERAAAFATEMGCRRKRKSF